MSDPIVIVGAGQAGLQVAESLRADKYEGGIVMVGSEPHVPYNRPPLSKKWLLEPMEFSSLAFRGPEALARRNLDLRLGRSAIAIDRAARTVRLDDGSTVRYAGLALATGARLRRLPVPGGMLGKVLGLRTVDDARAIAAALDDCAAAGESLVVVGGGFIGLEVAAAARKRGVPATVLEGLPRLMSRVVAPIVSEAALRVHRAHGVEFVFEARVTGLVGHDEGAGPAQADRVRAVRTADGREFPAGCVVVGIGVDPDDGIAAAAGIACERGIIVDDCARTSDPLVVAAGDCCARRRADGTLLRLESVQNAVEQGKAAAAALLGAEKPFMASPWFWSDQYDLKLQMTGLSTGYDEVITRGDLGKPAFSAYYFRAGRLIAVDSLSRIPDHMQARKLLDRGLSPTPAQVADEAFDLGSLLRTEPAGQ
jgi:3-phenylpropionate/trans-cinnamate dioxygenase ferredoxin reductase subunit